METVVTLAPEDQLRLEAAWVDALILREIKATVGWIKFLDSRPHLPILRIKHQETIEYFEALGFTVKKLSDDDVYEFR